MGRTLIFNSIISHRELSRFNLLFGWKEYSDIAKIPEVVFIVFVNSLFNRSNEPVCIVI